MVHVTTLVVALKTATLLLGGLITYFALKAYRRTGAGALRALALGFGIVTAGALLAGVVDRALPFPPRYALIVESALTALGFSIVLYSLYTE